MTTIKSSQVSQTAAFTQLKGASVDKAVQEKTTEALTETLSETALSPQLESEVALQGQQTETQAASKAEMMKTLQSLKNTQFELADASLLSEAAATGGAQFSQDELQAAYQRLLKAEGSSTDAREALELIKAKALPNESLSDLVDTYVTLAKYTKFSSRLRETYTLLNDAMKSGETRDDVVKSFVTLLEAERNFDQAAEAFEMIDKTLGRQDRAEQTQQFVRLLANRPENSHAALNAYELISNSIQQGETHETVTDTFMDLLLKERNYEQATQAFELINETLGRNDRSVQTKQYIRLLADNTRLTHDALDAYAMIAKAVRPGETHETVTDTFMDLLLKERQYGLAKKEFEVIDQLLGSDNRGEQTDYFLKMRAQNPHSSVAAIEAYRITR